MNNDDFDFDQDELLFPVYNEDGSYDMNAPTLKNENKVKTPACGNKDCGVSSGYADEITFGRNETESNEPFNGYWEIPCYVCAEDFKKKNPDMTAEYDIWPNKEN